MEQKKLIIKTKTQTYPIFIGNNLLSKLKVLTNENLNKFEKCLILIDKNVPKKNLNTIRSSFKNKQVTALYFEANERNKSQKSINKIIEILLKKNFSRQDCLIAVGGGITGDLAGFVASIFKRGLQFINIPTTLLAQVDSSIGGKTGINSIYGKNLVGTFYQPKLVISDTIFLKTLPRREIICGYGEILKHSLISDKKFFNSLNKNVLNILNLKEPQIQKTIYQSCKIKKKIIEKDEKESGLRKILNFGHTFAHAYEASLGFSKKLNHGEAVLLGIKSASKFSLENKFLKVKDYQLIQNHFDKAKLSFRIQDYFSKKDLNKLISFMNKDKKNTNNGINLILLNKIGFTNYDKNFSQNKVKLFLRNQLIN